MELFIKNLLVIRCMMIVKLELEKIGLNSYELELGRVFNNEVPVSQQIRKFRIGLLSTGIELLQNKKNLLINKMKKVIIEIINTLKGIIKINIPAHLSKRSDFNFTCIANLFSETAGNTLQQFIIKQRIKWVIDLIWLHGSTLNENSRRWHYICVVHLPTQFKKVSGMNPTCFKQMQLSHIGLESV